MLTPPAVAQMTAYQFPRCAFFGLLACTFSSLLLSACLICRSRCRQLATSILARSSFTTAPARVMMLSTNRLLSARAYYIIQFVMLVSSAMMGRPAAWAPLHISSISFADAYIRDLFSLPAKSCISATFISPLSYFRADGAAQAAIRQSAVLPRPPPLAGGFTPIVIAYVFACRAAS